MSPPWTGRRTKHEALAAIAAAAARPSSTTSASASSAARSELAQALRGVRDRETGMLLNGIRSRLEEAADGAARALADAELDRRLRDEVVDVTLPGEQLPARPPAPDHAGAARWSRTRSSGSATRCATTARSRRSSTTSTSSRSSRRTRRARRATRSSSTTTHVLRTETSPVADPRARGEARRRSTWSRSAASTGATRSRRRATRSSTSSRGSPSTEGLTLADLKGTLLHVMRAAVRAGPARPLPHALLPVHRAVDRAGRLVRDLRRQRLPHVQVLAAGSRWAAPAWSTRASSRTSASTRSEWSGFAFGCGLERTAQLRHDIPDIRALWEGDLRVLRQF